jgi:hypothetical protein
MRQDGFGLTPRGDQFSMAICHLPNSWKVGKYTMNGILRNGLPLSRDETRRALIDFVLSFLIIYALWWLVVPLWWLLR